MAGPNSFIIDVAGGGFLVLLQKLIEEAGANVNTSGKTTPLIATCHSGYIKCAELLLSHGANIEARDDLGRTCIMKASQGGHKELVELLIAHGADKHATDFDNENMLTYAAYQSSVACVKLALEHGVDVHTKTSSLGNSSVLCAGKMGNVEILVTFFLLFLFFKFSPALTSFPLNLIIFAIFNI